MHRFRAAVVAPLLVGLLVSLGVFTASVAGARLRPVDECMLLTKAQAKVIMGAEPFSPGAPDNGGCAGERTPTIGRIWRT